MAKTRQIVGIVGVALLLAGGPALGQVQREGQQDCINAVAKAGVRLAATQGRENTWCVRRAGRGRVADAQACLTADGRGRVAAGRARTSAAAVGRCDDVPDFGVPQRMIETVEAGALVHERGIVSDLFGSDLQAAVILAAGDRAGAACQAAVARDAERVAATMAGAFVPCVRRALASGASEGADLAACVGADAAGRIATAVARLGSTAAGTCGGVDTAAAFPGICAGLTGDSLAACVAGRARCRACRLLDAVGGVAADCDVLDDGAANESCRFLVSVSGDAIPFNVGPDARLEGAEISILEHPEMRMTTGADGHFRFDGLEEGSEVTLVLAHPEYHPIQTGTIVLGPAGAERVTFQAVTYTVYNLLAILLGLVPDEANRCQMVTTVTRVGRSLYDPGAHGEAGVTVALDPPLPADQGPIYFNASVLPDRTLTETSEDGGVLFVQVPPGEYEWTAHKAGAVFTRIKMKCRVGLLVNASPPWGLQRQ